ncbi:MAG: hypothetical protein ACJAT6_000841 [Akkermansiaceae bacterium]|jgi:hypothetical protein
MSIANIHLNERSYPLIEDMGCWLEEGDQIRGLVLLGGIVLSGLS